MRIALTAPGFPPAAVAGTEVASRRLAGALSRRGHEVIVLTRGRGGRYRSDGGYEVRKVFRDVHLANLHTPSMFRGLLKAIKDVAPDILHCQAFFGHTWFCVRSRRLTGVPVLAYGRGSDVYLPDSKMAERIVRDILKGADAVVAQTAHMARRMREIHSRDIHVVPNGVDIERFRSARSGTGHGVVLYVGRFRAVKNVPLAISAFKALKERLPHAEMLIAGDGPKAREVRQAAAGAEDVSLLGPMPNDDVPRLMAKADLLLLSSDSEGFPMTLLEAMASGLPIVCTSVGGIPDIVQDGIHGLLAPAGDAEALARHMERLLTDEELWLRMSRRNTRDAEHYSWDAVCERLEAIYRTLSPGPTND